MSEPQHDINTKQGEIHMSQSDNETEFYDHICLSTAEGRVRTANRIGHAINAMADIHQKLGLRVAQPGIVEWYGDNRASYIVEAIKLLSCYQGHVLGSIVDDYDGVK